MIQMATMAMVAETIKFTVDIATLVFGMKNSELLVGKHAALA